jgi:tetratricopeptide (TPR) repeat protein
MIEQEPYISKDEKRISRVSQAEFLEQKRRYNEAIDIYDQVINDNPEYIEAFLGKANCYIKKRRYNEAINIYEQVINDNPEYIEAFLGKANCYIKKRKYEKAKIILEKIIDTNPENIELNYLYGLILWYQTNYYKAVKYFYKIPNTSKLFPSATYFIALYLIYNKKYSNALSKLNYAIDNYSFDFKNNYLKLYILKEIDKKREFSDCLKEFLRENPFDYLANYWKLINEDENDLSEIFKQKQNIYNILSFFVQLKDWQSCINLLERYKKYVNDCDKLLLSYIDYFKNKINNKGINNLIDKINNMNLDYVFPNHDIDYMVLKEIKDSSKNAKYLYGLIAYRAENYDKAIRNWEELVIINFDYSLLYRNLAYYYQKFEENYQRAINLSKIGLKKKPHNDDFFKLLFDGYKNLDLKDKINELENEIKNIDDISEPAVRVWVDILNYLEKHQKAVQLIKDTNFKMYEEDPENLVDYSRIYKESYLGLTRQHMKNNNFKKALESVKECLKMEKKYEDIFAEIYFYTAVIYEKLNEFDKALQYYNEILDENIPEEDDNYKYYVKAANRIVNLNWIGIKRGE